MNFLIQWNINGIYSHSNELKTLICDLNPEILAIQETHLRTHHSFNLRNYSSYRFDFPGGNKACGGTAIFVKNSITSSPLNITMGNLQANAVTIETPNFCSSKLSICNIYIPPHQDISVHELDHLFSQIPKPYIVLGDFNAHSRTWGSSINNNRGNIIDKFLLKSDTFLLNRKKPTHFNISNGTYSNIDLAFCSPNISHLLNWNPHDDLHFSDHFPINISLCTHIQKPTHEKCPKWILNRANWSYFNDEVLPIDFTSDDLDTIVEFFTNSIIQAATKSIPKSSTKISKKTVPWWCEELKTAIQERKRALKKFKKNPSLENLICFKKNVLSLAKST